MKISQTMQAIQRIQEQKRSKEIPKTKVLFLYNTKNKDLFAFFPELYESEGFYLSYSIIGQHSSCSLSYAKMSRKAKAEEYIDLHNILINSGYNLEIINKNILKELPIYYPAKEYTS